MKLNYKSILVAAVLMFSGANANAGLVYDIYAGGTAGFGGMSLITDDHSHDHSAQSYGAIFGIDLPVVRFEAEYDFLTSERLDMQTLMGNAYVKLPGLVVVNPYIGVGVGVMFDTSNNHYDINFDSSMAYHGMLGYIVKITVWILKESAKHVLVRTMPNLPVMVLMMLETVVHGNA